MSRPFECRWTESDTMLEPAFSSRADFGSKKSALRPTSWTGQFTASSSVKIDERIRRLIRLAVEHLGPPDHVVEDEAPADGGAAAAGLGVDVVDFLDLERRDVAILGEPGRARSESRPTSPPRRP